MEYVIEIHVLRHSPTMGRLVQIKVDSEINRGGLNRQRMEQELARGIVNIRIGESGKDFVNGLIQSLVGLPDIEKFSVTHETQRGGTVRSRMRPMYGSQN